MEIWTSTWGCHQSFLRVTILSLLRTSGRLSSMKLNISFHHWLSFRRQQKSWRPWCHPIISGRKRRLPGNHLCQSKVTNPWEELHSIPTQSTSLQLGNGTLQHLPKRTLYTNHKPLENLGKVHILTLNRLQKAINTYDFEITYKKGSKMPSDYLSCHAVKSISWVSTRIKEEQDRDSFINALKQFLLNI